MTTENGTLIGAAAAVVILFAVAIFPGPFQSASTCDKCGKTRELIEWQVPLLPLTIIKSSRESDTPLSRVLLDNEIVSKHPHNWIFEYGSGNGIFCAIGLGRFIRRPAESEEFAAVVSLLHQRGQTVFLDRMVREVLNPRRYDLYHEVLSNPPDHAMSDSELDDWIVERTARFDEMIAASYPD
jgi:hypothetical protein